MVVCPDGSCKLNEFECMSPNRCNNPLLPFNCGDNSCAATEAECGNKKVCGHTFSLCEDG